MRSLDLPINRSINLLFALGVLAMMTGCHDARISIDQFVKMQRAAGAQQLAHELSHLDTAPQQNSVPQRRRFVDTSAHSTPQLAADQSATNRQPTQAQAGTQPTQNSARSKSSVVQVRSAAQSLQRPTANRDGKGQWFFDAVRGEWVRRSLPQRQLGIRPVNLTTQETNTEADEMATADESIEVSANPSSLTETNIAVDSNNMAATSQPVFASSDSPAQRPYLLGPEDVIAVSLTGLSGIDTLSDATEVNARIAHNGTVNLPLVGPVDVAGYDIVDAEKAIRAAYVPRFVPTLAVGVQVAQYKTTDVVVVGAAQLPGLVYLRRNERDVLHAVAAAGGMAQNASGEVILRRMNDPDKEVRLFLRDPAKLRSVLALDPLNSGDVVEVVAAQPNTIFVGGLVNLPGPREFPPGTKVSILQALAAAGGVIEDVFPKEGTLIRQMPNGEDVHVKLDLDRLRSGKDPNLQLAAGDILWVPETFGTRTMAFVNQTFFLRAGATVSYNVTGVEYLNRPAVQNGTILGGNGNNIRNSVDPLGFLAP